MTQQWQDNHYKHKIIIEVWNNDFIELAKIEEHLRRAFSEIEDVVDLQYTFSMESN